MVKVGSQLEMAHQPTVVTIDSTSRISVRRAASGSTNSWVSVNGRLPSAAAAATAVAPAPCTEVAFQRFSRTARCHFSDSLTLRRIYSTNSAGSSPSTNITRQVSAPSGGHDDIAYHSTAAV